MRPTVIQYAIIRIVLTIALLAWVYSDVGLPVTVALFILFCAVEVLATLVKRILNRINMVINQERWGR